MTALKPIESHCCKIRTGNQESQWNTGISKAGLAQLYSIPLFSVVQLGTIFPMAEKKYQFMYSPLLKLLSCIVLEVQVMLL